MPTKSDRSVIRFGNGGLVITIPKAWATFYEVQPGDKLTVITNDDIRILAPESLAKGDERGVKAPQAKREGSDSGKQG